MKWIAGVVMAGLVAGVPGRQPARDAAFDRLLDANVRDGLVYYRALTTEQALLDGYVTSLDIAPDTLQGWAGPEQEAFWINAYNAIVLQTVVRHYPIHGASADYPADSIRQIPGAFDGVRHRVAGGDYTLDQIETHLLDEFGDARIVFALSRGAVGGGRLRSEAYRADAIEDQLGDAASECAAHVACFQINQAAGTVTVTPLFGWRAESFERSYPGDPNGPWVNRTPLERAIVTMVAPHLFPSERTYLSANTFRLAYHAFDWSLNDR